MSITKSEMLGWAVTLPCAAYNAYVAPKSFSVSFAAGVVVGFFCDSSRNMGLVGINLIQRIFHEKYQENNTHVYISKPEIVGKFYKLPGSSAFRLRLLMLNLGAVRQTKTNVAWSNAYNNDKEFEKIKGAYSFRLPSGWQGIVLSIITTAGNIGAAAYPILGKIGLLSGFTSGFMAGTVLANAVYANMQKAVKYAPSNPSPANPARQGS